MKQQLNARISDATREKLDDLTARYGTQAEAIAVAVDRLWQDHNRKNSTMTYTIDSDTEYDLEDLEKSFGTVEHDEKTLYLLGQAAVDNWGTDGLVRYYAKAIDAEGTEYRVAWDTTEEWDMACELDRLTAESDPNDDQIARIDQLAEMALPDVSDESNACDWSHPAKIEVS